MSVVRRRKPLEPSFVNEEHVLVDRTHKKMTSREQLQKEAEQEWYLYKITAITIAIFFALLFLLARVTIGPMWTDVDDAEFDILDTPTFPNYFEI